MVIYNLTEEQMAIGRIFLGKVCVERALWVVFVLPLILCLLSTSGAYAQAVQSTLTVDVDVHALTINVSSNSSSQRSGQVVLTQNESGKQSLLRAGLWCTQ